MVNPNAVGIGPGIILANGRFAAYIQRNTYKLTFKVFSLSMFTADDRRVSKESSLVMDSKVVGRTPELTDLLPVPCQKFSE
jgi:hypothetical protein